MIEPEVKKIEAKENGKKFEKAANKGNVKKATAPTATNGVPKSKPATNGVSKLAGKSDVKSKTPQSTDAEQVNSFIIHFKLVVRGHLP